MTTINLRPFNVINHLQPNKSRRKKVSIKYKKQTRKKKKK